MTKKQIIIALRKHQKVIAKERDALRKLSWEVDELFQDCDSGIDDLQSCIDTLSASV